MSFFGDTWTCTEQAGVALQHSSGMSSGLGSSEAVLSQHATRESTSGFLASSFGTGLVAVSLGISVPQMFACHEKKTKPIIPHTSNLTAVSGFFVILVKTIKNWNFLTLCLYSYLPDSLVSSLNCSIMLMSVLQNCIQDFETFLLSGYLCLTFELGASSCCCSGKYFQVKNLSFLLFQLSFSIL